MRKERKNLPLASILPNLGQLDWLPKNPRQWTKGDIDRTAVSIREDPDFLEDRPLLVVPFGDETFIVFAGNLRREGGIAAPLASAPSVVYFPETAEDYETIKRRAMKDNGSFGSWDFDELANSWDDLPLVDWGVPAWEGEAKKDEPEPESTVSEDDFDEDKDEIHVRCQPGDVWELGEHRLVCGDSTDAECFANLMNGERADIAFTSPPYGVNDGHLRNHQSKGKFNHEAKNFYKTFDDNQGVWPRLIEEAWQRMHEYTDQQFINIQMLADNKRELARWCARHADNLVDILIWDKGHAAPQMQSNVVNNNFEFIYVFGDENASRVIKHGNFHGNFGAIVRVGIGQNKYADIHKAVFPVDLPAEILKINGNAKSVLDCFGGTGTTMIAAEQLGRKCYMMELDPNYCDVIIARWEKLTGERARKL